MTVPVDGAADDLVAAGRAALRRGDAAAARQSLERALALSASGDVLEGLARAAYLDLDFAGAISGLEPAYAAHRGADDRVGAVRVARTLPTCTCRPLVIGRS